MPLISIIVPVYNAEKYLKECVDSILCQTFKDFELILIDDGSTDNCSEICDAYAKMDSRVCVIHKENGGQAEARNRGIDIAQGQYITFIDSDDWVCHYYLEQMFSAIHKTGADISLCGLQSFDDGESITLESKKDYRYDCLSGREVCTRYYQMEWIINVGPVGKLFSVNLINDTRFPNGKIYEDQGTIPRLIYPANKVAFIKDSSFYAYRIRSGSTSHSDFSSRKFEDVWNVELCRRFFADKGDAELEDLCARFRDILQAKYIVLAHGCNAQNQIPVEYKISLHKALNLLRKEINDDTYTWYLEQVHPGWVKPHSYLRKIKSILGFGRRV